jgi:hypothetical protein
MMTLGWIGAFCLIYTYGSLTLGKVSSDSFKYQMTNLVGAMLLGVSSAAIGAWFSVFLNIFWLVVAIVGLSKTKK